MLLAIDRVLQVMFREGLAIPTIPWVMGLLRDTVRHQGRSWGNKTLWASAPCLCWAVLTTLAQAT